MYKITYITFLSIGLILSLFSLFYAFSIRSLRNNYFSNEAIIYEEFSVRVDDNAIISAVAYIPEAMEEKEDGSVPSLLMLNGINSRKEFNIEKAYQFVKLGYAVFSVEQRGHGESTGPSGFLGKEPYDMMKVIDYIKETYFFANTSHMGLLGFSFGGGVGAILQAEDERIFASVLYHPLTSLNGLTERIPFQNLIGSTPTIDNLENIDDALDIANSNNTENLLILHGKEDELILPEESQEFYEKIDGKTRKDIDLILRANLGHSGNEADEDSLKYAIAWLEHFYHDNTINLTDLKSEINDIELEKFSYPEDGVAEILLLISLICLYIGISTAIVTRKVLPQWEAIEPDDIIITTSEKAHNYNKMLILRTLAYISPVFIVGLIFSIFNKSLLYGYFLVYPIVGSIFLLFIPSEIHGNWKNEWKTWLKRDSKFFLYCLITIFLPFLYFMIIFDLISIIMLKPLIPFLNTTFFLYIAIGFSTVMLDYLYLREWKPRHTFILIAMRPFTLGIYILFVPLQPFPLLGGVAGLVLFFILIGVILFYWRQFALVMSKYYKSFVCIYFIFLMPFLLFFIYIFFRII